MPHRICYSEKYFDEVYEYRYKTRASSVHTLLHMLSSTAQTRHSTERRSLQCPSWAADERGGMEKAGRSAVAGLGPLHGAQTW